MPEEILNPTSEADWSGFQSAAKARVSPQRLTEALRLIRNERSLSHYAHEFQLKEAITTSDFPLLFGVLVQQEMLAKYGIAVADWRSYCKTGTLPNFNIATKHKIYGQDNILLPVPSLAPYPGSPSGTGHYHGQLAKYGRRFEIAWEAVVNDSLGAFNDLAERFANAVTRTEAWHVTQLFASAAGPNVNLFGATITDVDGQAITNQGVLALTIANLQTTLALMSRQTDPNGEPIAVRGVHLVVPSSLEFTARSILTSALQQQTGSAVPVPVTNILPQLGIQLHVDPYLEVLDATGNDVGTWYVFADPSQGKAMQLDYWSGGQAPEVCMKASNKVSLGGGTISPFDGDFDADDIQYRVRCIHAGWRLDPRFAYAQVHN
jgi:hypothetical protein